MYSWYTSYTSAICLIFADTAAVYKNEASIGDILRQLCPKHNLEPKDIFVTSKLGMLILQYGTWMQVVLQCKHFAPQEQCLYCFFYTLEVAPFWG